MGVLEWREEDHFYDRGVVVVVVGVEVVDDPVERVLWVEVWEDCVVDRVDYLGVVHAIDFVFGEGMLVGVVHLGCYCTYRLFF